LFAACFEEGIVVSWARLQVAGREADPWKCRRRSIVNNAGILQLKYIYYKVIRWKQPNTVNDKE
jgi:hypothetical protein